MRQHGFTLIELLVVLAIIATLLSIAAPRYIGSVDKAKEAVLKENLASLRLAIDKFAGDMGQYPSTLDELVSRRYLRGIPVDPITDSTRTWILLAPSSSSKGIFDIKSGASGLSRDGTPYSEW